MFFFVEFYASNVHLHLSRRIVPVTYSVQILHNLIVFNKESVEISLDRILFYFVPSIHTIFLLMIWRRHIITAKPQ